MLNWTEYVKKLLLEHNAWDSITLSIEDQKTCGVPQIVKASVLLLDNLQRTEGKNNIIVFPERLQSSFIFTIIKLLHNISDGRIDHTYDPSTFKPGDKLKCGNSVVEFVENKEVNNEKRMVIKFADGMTVENRIEIFPLFQYTNTKRRISPYKTYIEEKRAIEAKYYGLSTDEKFFKVLSDYKTHMDSSIVYMTPVGSTKELISECTIGEKKITDYVLIGNVDYSGNIKNISSGQLSGTPAIVLASDLYSVVALKEKGHPIQSVIIDVSNANALSSQLDALNELLQLNVPITCVTDVVNSFDLQPFEDRGFNIWRWNESSITKELYSEGDSLINRKVSNCANRNVKYLKSSGKEIGEVFRLLSSHRSESKEQSPEMMKIFDMLYGLSFTALRETIYFKPEETSAFAGKLYECKALLENEKHFISTDTYSDYKFIINALSKILSTEYKFDKHSMMCECLVEFKNTSVCIVMPENADKRRIYEYWNNWCNENRLNIDLEVLSPAEFYSGESNRFDSVIVIGWLKRAIMRKILYSFNTANYTVLLYDYENRWKRYDDNKWNSSLHNSENKRIIKNIFAQSGISVQIERFDEKEEVVVIDEQLDELNEIELVLRENKYRQYTARGGTRPENETVEAIPINYIGGYFAFYRTGHKIISASDIILNEGSNIENILPDELSVGDFVVVRESSKDIVRELADVILSNSGMSGLRESAHKWKEALDIEKLFNTEEQIFERLQRAGCTRGYPTVLRWLNDDEFIAPQSKEDMECIAKVTESTVLMELLDDIFDAAQTVKTAHVRAGKVISEMLRNRIVESLREYGEIDPFNIWNPIEMYIDGVGNVKILKIIDIGTPVIVDIADTNRLISE